MKSSRNIVSISMLIAIISITLSIGITRGWITFIKLDSNFILNTLIGAISGAVLATITALISYFNEKREYYLNFEDKSFNMIHNLIFIISYFEDQKSLDVEFQRTLINTKVLGEGLKFLCLRRCWFIRKGKVDKLIETILLDYIKFMKTVELHAIASEEYAKKIISENDHRTSFNIIRNELINEYKPKFVKYKVILENIRNKEIGNDVLTDYFGEFEVEQSK